MAPGVGALGVDFYGKVGVVMLDGSGPVAAVGKFGNKFFDKRGFADYLLYPTIRRTFGAEPVKAEAFPLGKIQLSGLAHKNIAAS